MNAVDPGTGREPGDALVATCWTSAGDAAPLRGSQISPVPATERVRAVAAAGYAGMGFVLEDLRVIRDGIGYPALARELQAAGLQHVEVELAGGWWREDGAWRGPWEELLQAARALGAAFIKVGTDEGEALEDVGVLAAPLRTLAQEAQAAGTRVALEPLPFAMVSSLPAGADLIRAVGHPAAGLVVDYWHVFRAGTSLRELQDCLDPGMVFGVELNDADAEPVGTLFEDTRDRRRYPGRGAQDVAGFVRAMREVGFDGPWGVEMLSDEHRALPVAEGLRIAAETTREVMAASRRG